MRAAVRQMAGDGRSGALRPGLILLLAGIALGSCGSARGHAADVGPGAGDPRGAPAGASFHTVRLSVWKGEEAEPFDTPHSLRVPAGWSAEVWARVPEARFALWTPEGDLLVSRTDAGSVDLLSPAADPAAAPSQRELLTGLSMPQGMAFDTLEGQTVLYVAQSDQVDRYPWLGGGRLGQATVVAGDLPDAGPPGEDTHRLKSLAVAPDHTVYFSVGSATNAKAPSAAEEHHMPPRASIDAVAPDGHGMRVIARGVRNGEGLAFAPDGSLWDAINNRDEIPYPFHRSYGGLSEAFGHVLHGYVNEHPPDELARLAPGTNLGWPYCNPDPDRVPGRPGRGLHYTDLHFIADAITNRGERVLACRRLKPLALGLPAHSAPLGLTFLEGSKLPAPWSDGAVLAAHGSWDRTTPRAPALLWLPWHGSGLGAPTTLVGGFQEASGARWGRPVDAVPGPDGDLYLTDDQAGAVYRIGPAGG